MKDLTKAEVLERMQRSRAEWDSLMAAVGEARMDEPGVEGVWAVRDIIAHLSAYERWTAVKVLTDVHGETPTNLGLYGRAEVPAEIETLDEDAYNAWVVEYERTRPLREVLEENAQGHELLVQAIELLSEDEIRDDRRFGWLQGRSLAQILPNQSFNHYAMHMPVILRWLAEQKVPQQGGG